MTMKPQKDTGDARDKEGPRSFAHIITQLGGGDVHRDLSDDLHELMRAVQDQVQHIEGSTKIRGEMSIKIKLTADAYGVCGLDVDSSIKKPKRRRPTRQAFITAGGNLTTEHPRQTELPLQEVGRRGVAQEVPDVSREAREV